MFGTKKMVYVSEDKNISSKTFYSPDAIELYYLTNSLLLSVHFMFRAYR